MSRAEPLVLPTPSHTFLTSPSPQGSSLSKLPQHKSVKGPAAATRIAFIASLFLCSSEHFVLLFAQFFVECMLLILLIILLFTRYAQTQVFYQFPSHRNLRESLRASSPLLSSTNCTFTNSLNATGTLRLPLSIGNQGK